MLNLIITNPQKVLSPPPSRAVADRLTSLIFSLGFPLAAANLLGNLAGSTMAIKKGSRLVQAFLLLSLFLLLVSLVWKFFIIS